LLLTGRAAYNKTWAYNVVEDFLLAANLHIICIVGAGRCDHVIAVAMATPALLLKRGAQSTVLTPVRQPLWPGRSAGSKQAHRA